MENIKCEPDRAVVSVNGEFEQEMMLQLVTAMQHLCRDYFYTRIELEVCSPGGQIIALDYCLQAMDALRADGISFTTEADELCNAQRYEHSPDRVDTRAVSVPV